MSFSYDTSLSSDLAWVRFLIGDVTSATAVLSDEEIAAIITVETKSVAAATKYAAAATAGTAAFARWQATGKGISAKAVDGLSIKRESGEDANRAYLKMLQGYREKSAELQFVRPAVFRVVR